MAAMKDCFGYSNRKEQCMILTETICQKPNKECHFYKPKHMKCESCKEAKGIKISCEECKMRLNNIDYSKL